MTEAAAVVREQSGWIVPRLGHKALVFHGFLMFP